MPRGDQLARQWRIIQTLMTSKIGKSAAELARELSCNPRTVYRDLEALQVAGFPIYTERVEGKNLWSLLDVLKHHIPIPFSFPELMALYFSRDLLKVFKETVFYDSLESLFEKIKTTLPPDSVKYLNTMEDTFRLSLKPYKDYGRFKEIINRVNEAAVKRRSIEIAYYTMSRKKKTKRKVDPYKVWFFNGTFYLIGYCHLRKEVRTFALDRITMLHTTNEGFRIPEDFDLEAFMKPSFGVITGEPTTVRVWFDPEVSGYIKEKIWHESQKLETQEDGSLIFEAEVALSDEIKYWIMSWGAHAEVLEPESLREAIQTEAGLMAENYRKGARRAEETVTA